MYPILFQAGGFSLATYPVLLNVGLLFTLVWLYRQAPPDQRSAWVDVGLAGAVGALAGARLVYVAVNFTYYGQYPLEIFAVWQGGLAWPGAVLGGALAAWGWSRRAGVTWSAWVDALAWPLAGLGGLGWLGCLGAGCAYGAEVTPGALPAWLLFDIPDVYGVVTPRWPTALLGVAWSALSAFLLWGVLQSAARRWQTGARGWYALSQVALGMFLLSFLRGDPSALYAGLRLDTLGSAVILLVATFAWSARAATPAPLAST